MGMMGCFQDYCDGGTLDDVIKDAAERREHLSEKQIIHVSKAGIPSKPPVVPASRVECGSDPLTV